MDFAFSDDQQQLRAAARRLFAERVTDERLAAVADGPVGHDPELWTELVGLGWVGLSAPDGGGTFLDESVLLEEAGYALAPVPLLSTAVTLPAVVAVGADPLRSAVVAWGEQSGAEAFGNPAALRCTATRTAGSWSLTGAKVDVADLGAAELVGVVARDDATGGALVAVLEPATTRGAVTGLPETTDTTRRIGQLSLHGAAVPAAAVAAPAAGLLVAIRRRALSGLALESVGIAQRALDIAVAHASTREQFGRVIGTYQAVSHRVADVYVATELARSLAYRAAWYVATAETEPAAVDPGVVDSACSAAKASAGEAGVLACEGLIQVLGGMGMTWEHVAHRFYKRALANRTYAGAPARHRALVAAALLDG
ncbi:MAG: acyl-CoA dehydrogenase family protein [Actinomycetes bacterium]